MRVLVAGGSGDIGHPAVRHLLERGHEVVATTRTPSKVEMLEETGARAVIMDALDAPAVEAAVDQASPEVVVDLLTALPRGGPVRPSQLRATNVLRRRGTANLLSASRRFRVHRYVAESIVFAYGYGDLGERPLVEDDPLAPVAETPPPFRPALEALRAKERAVLEAGLGGVVLRFGVFYGPSAGSTSFMARLLRRRILVLPSGDLGITPWVHLDDAARAVALAATGGTTGTFNVVDDEPVAFHEFVGELARRLGVRPPYRVPPWLVRPLASYAVLFMARTRIVASNERARRELGWRPAFATYREGLADVVATLTGRTTGRSAPS